MFVFRNIFFRFVYILSGLLILSSCNDPDVIGLDVQPQSDLINLKFSDTTHVTAYTVSEDSLRCDETTLQLLGSYMDSVFGRTDAAIYAQVTPPQAAVNFGDTLGLDSLVLTLAYNGYYGDTTQQTFHVYQLTEDMSYDAVYYSNKTFGHDATQELGSATITPSPHDSVTVYGSKTAPQLRINLDTALGNTFLNWSGQTQLSTPDIFLSNFKGLYIKVDSVNSGGGIFYFDLLASQSKMTLYYHKGSSSNFQDSLHYDFVFASNRARMSHFNHDYATTLTPVNSQLNDTMSGTNKVYVQSMAGVKTKIRFPHIMDYIKDGMIAVNKAEVEITVADSSTAHWAVPAKLLLLGVDSAGTALFLPDQFGGASYYGGDYNSSTRKYKFNIALYLQNILTGKTKDYGLYLAVSGGSVQANRAIIYDLTNTSDKMKLNLFYTKPN